MKTLILSVAVMSFASASVWAGNMATPSSKMNPSTSASTRSIVGQDMPGPRYQIKQQQSSLYLSQQNAADKMMPMHSDSMETADRTIVGQDQPGPRYQRTN